MGRALTLALLEIALNSCIIKYCKASTQESMVGVDEDPELTITSQSLYTLIVVIAELV